MYETIKNFHKQFEYEPKIENEERLTACKNFVVLGMGGSHLAADLLKTWNPYLNVIIHQDYGLPALHDEAWHDTLVIASSYSGNTEEVLDGFKMAQEKNCSIAAVATGGKLLDLARELKIPYIQMPDVNIQPRSALGFSIKALFKLMREDMALHELESLAVTLHPEKYEPEGKALSEKLRNFVPIIYASVKNWPIAYNWKIKFNETGKIPAFYNVLPELNHNEMTGFDAKESSKVLSEKFYFLLLRDSDDHFKVLKRMEVLGRMYRERGLPVVTLDLRGRTQFEKIFSSLILADWTAYFTAQIYGLEAEQVPMVEEFKKLVS